MPQPDLDNPARRATVLVPETPAADAGRLVLRLALGLMMLMHGLQKVQGGPGSVMQMLEGAGLPAVLAYGVYLGEVVAPVLLIIGVMTRAAAGVIVVNMLFAIGLAHAQDIFMRTPTGGWAIKLQGLYLFGAVALVLLGAGRYAVGGARGRWN